jgi:hypothetical protein
MTSPASGPAAVSAPASNPFQSASLYVGDLANDISEVILLIFLFVLLIACLGFLV